jgi:hypothetical protein
MTATTTDVRPRRPPRVRLVWIVPAVFAIAVAVLLVNLSTSLPGRERVVVRNATDAPVTLHTSGPDGAVLGLGTVDPGATTTFEEVADQGSSWRFRFSVGPHAIGQLRRSADQLDAAGWRITIPAGAADSLDPAQRPG